MVAVNVIFSSRNDSYSKDRFERIIEVRAWRASDACMVGMK